MLIYLKSNSLQKENINNVFKDAKVAREMLCTQFRFKQQIMEKKNGANLRGISLGHQSIM